MGFHLVIRFTFLRRGNSKNKKDKFDIFSTLTFFFSFFFLLVQMYRRRSIEPFVLRYIFPIFIQFASSSSKILSSTCLIRKFHSHVNSNAPTHNRFSFFSKHFAKTHSNPDDHFHLITFT